MRHDPRSLYSICCVSPAMSHYFPSLMALSHSQHLNFKLSKSSIYKLGDEFRIYEDDISGPVTGKDVKERLIQPAPTHALSLSPLLLLYSQPFRNPSVFSWPMLMPVSSRRASAIGRRRGGTTTAHPRASWNCSGYLVLCCRRETCSCSRG